MGEIVYLDNAATSFPKPKIVHDTMHNFYMTCGVNPGRTGCDLACQAEDMILNTRKKLSDFFNPSLLQSGVKKDPNRLVFTLNATMALNLIINGTVGPGDHIVTTTTEHNSVIRPVNHKTKQGSFATFVRPDKDGYIDPEDIRNALRENTKLVIVNHASNVTGVVQDIQSIGAVCRQEGVPFAIDAAQTAGVLPIDMTTCNISFLSFTGHKGLFGPTGTGGICVADDAEIQGTIFGGTGVRSIDLYHLEQYPYRLEAGTLNLAGIAGLSAGIDWIQEKGIHNIYAHEMHLLEHLQNGLAEIPGVEIKGSSQLKNRVATLSILVENYDAADVGAFLDVDYNIQSRTGLHCAPLMHAHTKTTPRGTVRLSIGPYNTRDQIDFTMHAVEKIASSRRQWRPKAARA